MKATFLLLPLAAGTALATGDFFEETVPSLPVFLSYDRLPKKSLVDITRELNPPAAKEADFPREIRSIADAIKGGAAPGAQKKKVEDLLASERARVVRSGSGLNALLQDLLDLCSGTAGAPEASGYLEWRLKHGYILGYDPERNYENIRDPWGGREKDPAVAAEIEKAIADAPESMRPHYLYAQAAWSFRSGDDDTALFQKLIEKFPAHPRSEAAAYMVARCLARQSRAFQPDATYKNVPEKVAEAKAAFDSYARKYPTGRFVGDAYGWLGGLELNAERSAEAVAYFTRQLGVEGHPELAVGATKEIEICFRQLHDQPEALAAALKDPRVAEAAVYFALNEIEPVDGNGEYESAEFVAEWRKKLLVAVAAALANQRDAFKAAGLESRHIASLALAAGGAGRVEEALKLLEQVDAESTDDLIFAKAVVYQRARKPAEAASAFALLRKKFPTSVLSKGSKTRQALALVDDHRAGEAAMVLMDGSGRKKAVKPSALPVDSEKESIKDGAEEEERDYDYIARELQGVEPEDPLQQRQILDSVFNFAPLEELSRVVEDSQYPDESRLRLRRVIAVRHLARERFAEAQQFMPAAEWKLVAEPLATLAAAEKAAKTPADKAAAAVKLADAWAAARGRLLTVPLDTDEWRIAVMKDEHPLMNSRRMENAAAMGLKGATVLDLENRDELRHAFNWWITASDAQPRGPLAASAVWKALRSMRGIADVSSFTLDRAEGKKWQEVSRKLYDRIQTDYPDSPEAKRFAVWWTFPKGKSEDGTYSMRSAATSLVEQAGLGEENDDLGEQNGARFLALLSNSATQDIAAMRKSVRELGRWSRDAFTTLSSQCVLNFFDDLDAFFAVPGITPEIARRYLQLRYDALCSAAIGFGPFPLRPGAEKKDEPGTFRGDEALLTEIRAAKAAPEMKAVADFLGFLEIAVVANHWVTIPLTGKDKNGEDATYWGRDYVDMERLCRAWLEAYPKSPKREAALLLHCRALRHSMEPYVYWKVMGWPEGSRWEGEQKPVEAPRLKFDAKVWKAALDRYDREFPRGRYAADVLAYRGDLAVRMKDWKRAVQITLDALKGPVHLHPSANNRLREIFSHFREEEDRADLMAAVRAVPGARGALNEYLADMNSWTEHPLFWLSGWLQEESTQ